MKQYSIALCCLLVSSSALARIPDKSLETAGQLIAAGDPASAFALLNESFDQASATTDELFMMGLAAKRAGKLEQARSYLMTALQKAPDAHRIRLELAEIEMRAGDKEKARGYLHEVQLANPPAAVAQNIDRFLEVLNTTDPKSWRVWGLISMLYDSNPNSGPNVDTVTLFGLPFTLSSSAKPQESRGLQINLGFDHVLPLSDGWAVQTALNLKGTDYTRSKLETLDNVYGYGSTGLVYQMSPDIIWSLPVFVDGSTFRNGENWYSASYGFSPQVRYAVSPLMELSLGGTVARRDYQSEGRDDAVAWSLSPGASFALSPVTVLRATVSYGREDTDQEWFAYSSWSGNVSLSHQFTPALAFTAFARVSDIDYDAKEAAQSDIRSDRVWQLGGELAYQLPWLNGFDLVASGSWTRNDSNIDLYAFDRTLVSVGVRAAY